MDKTIVKIYLLLFIPFLFTSQIKIDFSESEADDWYVLNDGVMGGLSKGKVVESEEGVVFFGNVSLENNGGFTSYRGPWKNYDLSNYETVTIRYRSEGMSLALALETSKRFWIPNYKMSLSKSGEWTTKTFDLDAFGQYRLGNPTGKMLTGDAKKNIIRLGFVTDEKRAGDFKFELDYIEFS